VERLGPEAFDGERLLRPGAWIVDFSADWCPYCQDFLTTFSSLEGSREFRLAIGDLTDVETPLWELFALDVTPSLIAFRDGRVIYRVNGRRGFGLTEEDLRRTRAAVLDSDPGRGSDGPRS
jgi:thioredoxin-like negative regulator of GroEL